MKNNRLSSILTFMVVTAFIGFISCGSDDDTSSSVYDENGMSVVSNLNAEQLIGLWEPYHVKAWGENFEAEADVGQNGIDYTEVHRFEFDTNGHFQSYSYENYNYSGEWKWIPNGHKGSYVIEGYHVFIYKNSLDAAPRNDFIVNKINANELMLTEYKNRLFNQYFMKRVN